MRSQVPTYESESDLVNETYVAECLEPVWECKFLRSPQFWPVDWSVRHDGFIKSFVEIKCRGGYYTYEYIDKLGGYAIDFRKIVSFRGFEDTSGLPCILVIRTADHKVLKWKYDRSYRPDLKYTGRHDRGPSKVETQAILPMSLFKEVMQVPVMSPEDEERIKDKLRKEGRI
jgi:hypothetical protein